jgi:hypothetical protein
VKRNITLAIEEDLLLEAKVLAARERSSVSALMTEALAARVRRDSDYAAAAARQIALMERGFDMGSTGIRTWTRDDLYDR